MLIKQDKSFMEKVELRNLKVDGSLSGDRIVDIRYAKMGAIGIRKEGPEFKRRLEKALETYAASVYDDMHGSGSHDRYIRPQVLYWRSTWRLQVP